MSEALRELQLIQFGIETVPGTLVAADTVLLGDELAFNPEIERVVLEEPRGILADLETVDVRRGTRFSYAGNADFEQILLPLLTGLDGGMSGVDQDSGGPYLWSCDPGLTAAEALKAATFEFIESDGSTEHVEREAGYMTCESFQIEIAMNALTRLSAAYFGRADQASTVTAALSPLSRTLIPGNLWTIAVDDTGANLGNTAFPGHLRSATLAVNTGVTPKYSAKGRTDLDLTGINRSKITGTFNATVELDTNAGDSGEFGDWRASGGNRRFVRLKATVGTKVLEIDLCCRWISAPQIAVDGSVKTLQLSGQLFYDPTWGKVINPKVTNALASF